MSFADSGSHAVATLVAVVLFSVVWLGLATNVRKIAARDANPPSFDPALNAAHLGRFAGWALLGAATWPVDPWTGVMLMVTRTPAAGLVLVTFLQRRVLRPPPALLVQVLVPTVGGLVAVCVWMMLDPPGAAVGSVLRAFVIVCFAVQALFALPRQILEAREKPLGNLRWFQMALLANYAGMQVYAFWVREPGVQILMQVAYGVVLVEQAVLVALIERGVRARNRSA